MPPAHVADKTPYPVASFVKMQRGICIAVCMVLRTPAFRAMLPDAQPNRLCNLKDGNVFLIQEMSGREDCGGCGTTARDAFTSASPRNARLAPRVGLTLAYLRACTKPGEDITRAGG